VHGDALRDAAEGLGFTIVGEPVEDRASQEQSSERSRGSTQAHFVAVHESHVDAVDGSSTGT
jgi:hypothetical protein